MKIITSILFAIPIFLLGQNKNTIRLGCYLPNGEKCNMNITSNLTVGEINTKFEEHGRVWNAYIPDEEVDIHFRAFTMVPLFVLTPPNKDYSSDKIKEFISMVNENNSSYIYYFGINRFGHHWGVKSGIKKYVEKKILDQAFLLNTLGLPSEIKDSLYGGNPTKCFVYKEVGIRIYFVNKVAIGAEEFE